MNLAHSPLQLVQEIFYGVEVGAVGWPGKQPVDSSLLHECFHPRASRPLAIYEDDNVTSYWALWDVALSFW